MNREVVAQITYRLLSEEAIRGVTPCCEVRSEPTNMLLTGGGVTIADWPQVCRGAVFAGIVFLRAGRGVASRPGTGEIKESAKGTQTPHDHRRWTIRGPSVTTVPAVASVVPRIHRNRSKSGNIRRAVPLSLIDRLGRGGCVAAALGLMVSACDQAPCNPQPPGYLQSRRSVRADFPRCGSRDSGYPRSLAVPAVDMRQSLARLSPRLRLQCGVDGGTGTVSVRDRRGRRRRPDRQEPEGAPLVGLGGPRPRRRLGGVGQGGGAGRDQR